MHPLETYYLNEAGRGLSPTPGIGPIYSAPLYLQRGHGIGNFLGILFRFVRPLLGLCDVQVARSLAIWRIMHHRTCVPKISYRNMSAMPSPNPHIV